MVVHFHTTFAQKLSQHVFYCVQMLTNAIIQFEINIVRIDRTCVLASLHTRRLSADRSLYLSLTLSLPHSSLTPLLNRATDNANTDLPAHSHTRPHTHKHTNQIRIHIHRHADICLIVPGAHGACGRFNNKYRASPEPQARVRYSRHTRRINPAESTRAYCTYAHSYARTATRTCCLCVGWFGAGSLSAGAQFEFVSRAVRNTLFVRRACRACALCVCVCVRD